LIVEKPCVRGCGRARVPGLSYCTTCRNAISKEAKRRAREAAGAVKRERIDRALDGFAARIREDFAAVAAGKSLTTRRA